MGFAKYEGGIELGAGLKPFGDGKFPLMQSCDIMVEESGKRLDTELVELRKLSGQGSLPKPKEISTEAEMNSILANATGADIGTIYKYVGTTTDTYENGALYIITHEIPDGDEVSH
jgi:hypothetical protein